MLGLIQFALQCRHLVSQFALFAVTQVLHMISELKESLSCVMYIILDISCVACSWS